MSQSFPFDVFLSHRSKDKSVVRSIADVLRADGLDVWLDDAGNSALQKSRKPSNTPACSSSACRRTHSAWTGRGSRASSGRTFSGVLLPSFSSNSRRRSSASRMKAASCCASTSCAKHSASDSVRGTIHRRKTESGCESPRRPRRRMGAQIRQLGTARARADERVRAGRNPDRARRPARARLPARGPRAARRTHLPLLDAPAPA